ncbi:ATP synthase subunit I [Polaromonas sp. A23]|uniref:ATP synthase subunit I n=1 Tax=Polaromonas sp. A23 TaxID=1944133 RepID=UPI000985FDC9|nr:ATP synthase subunit I [Polaromonas sp. A23]OOG45197.1 ATP synthase subunit I [Polaromonas sp. A23]
MTDAAVDRGARVSDHRDETEQDDFKPLTREEAQQLRKNHPQVSLWHVLVGQFVAGVLVALLAWILTGKQSAGWSALYGSLAVVIPAALFARGLTGKVWSMNPGTAVAGFFLWEMVKVALTLAMLFAAPRLVSMLSWPIMLVGLVVTMKVSWFALFLAARHKKL